MSTIILNGEPKTIAPAQTIAALLATLALGNKRVAVEVNLEIIPRSLFAQTLLQAGDRVEIVHAIGGG